MILEGEIGELIDKAAMAVERMDRCVEEAWLRVGQESDRAIWWDEEELILPFYFHLRPKIEEMNENLEGVRLCIIPEYAPKASSYASDFSGRYRKYPLLSEGKREYVRTKKVDLCIVAFDRDDLETKARDSGMTYWYVRHAPVVLLEFKLLSKKWLLPKMGDDLKKLREIEQKYVGVRRVYFCYLSDEKVSDEECRDSTEKAKIGSLRICYGTADGLNWGVA